MNHFKENSKNAVRSLREQGYEVEITHTRPMIGFTGWVDGTPDSTLSRKEFTEIVKSGDFDLVEPAGIPIPAEELRYGHFVSATGGFTRIQLLKDGEVKKTVKYNFGSKENFSKSKGVFKALAKSGMLPKEE